MKFKLVAFQCAKLVTDVKIDPWPVVNVQMDPFREPLKISVCRVGRTRHQEEQAPTTSLTAVTIVLMNNILQVN